MSTELKIPAVGESIQEVQIGRWLKQEGDRVELDENVVELETDKASMELPAPVAGVIQKILKTEGESVSVGETIAYLEENPVDPPEKAEDKPAPTLQPLQDSQKAPPTTEVHSKGNENEAESIAVTPAGRRALLKHGLRPQDIQPAGNRIRREDVLEFVKQRKSKGNENAQNSGAGQPRITDSEVPVNKPPAADDPRDEIVPMTLIRKRIAARLVAAQQNAALLTTFNEIDMSAVIKLRKEYGERFRDKYKVKLGFMSFFVKAAIDALKEVPEINAEIRGTDIVYHNYFDIAIAIGSERGLVVPVLRQAERMTFAEIELAIDDLALRAHKNKLEPSELTGGTFTITNGGIYGSLLSTPIVNPPQSGVLGMHVIEDRPVARDGQVIVLPMMYVALTYDHRLVDGRQAVAFLQRIKQAIDEPSRMLLEI